MVEIHTAAWSVAGVFSLLSVAISIHLIRNHVHNFTDPIVQSKIVGILWMVPIYSLDSWLSLVFKDASVYLDMIRDVYEAYVIYLFLALMIAYLGGGEDEPVVDILENIPPMSHPFPLSCCTQPIMMGRSFLKNCKFAAMQYVLLKPLTTLIAMILESVGKYCQGEFDPSCGYPYLALVVNFSTTYAFYWLVMFYVALRGPLAPYSPIPKFICVKSVLFLSFWQSVVIAALSKIHIIHDVGEWTAEDVATGAQNFLICFEMLLAAVAHTYAFPYAPYMKSDYETSDYSSAYSVPISNSRSLLRDHFASKAAIKDFNEVMPVVIPSGFKPGSAVHIRRGGAAGGNKHTVGQQRGAEPGGEFVGSGAGGVARWSERDSDVAVDVEDEYALLLAPPKKGFVGTVTPPGENGVSDASMYDNYLDESSRIAPASGEEKGWTL